MTTLIAITGGSGAGKTTLARALARRLGAVVIAEDDYYRCASTYANFDAATHNFDAPDTKEHALLRDHLALAKRGDAFEKPLYDLVTHRRRAETESISPTQAIIIEGIHLLVPPDLRGMFDLKVFIEADDALRLGRRMIRDVEARGRSPRSVLTQFFTNVRPMHDAYVAPQRAHADVVLHSSYTDNPDSAEKDAEHLAALVSST